MQAKQVKERFFSTFKTLSISESVFFYAIVRKKLKRRISMSMRTRAGTSAEEFFLKSINVESIFEFVERTDYLFLYSIKECVEKSDCHEGGDGVPQREGGCLHRGHGYVQ